MSHSFNGPSDHTTFNYNSDLSGTVHVSVKYGLGGWTNVDILAEDLLAFAAHVIRNRRIEALEQASDEQILGFTQTT